MTINTGACIDQFAKQSGFGGSDHLNHCIVSYKGDTLKLIDWANTDGSLKGLEAISAAEVENRDRKFVFYLGTHMPNWLWTYPDAALFISRVKLQTYKTLKEAKCDWALDSGGYSELNNDGKWSITTTQFSEMVKRFMQIGRMRGVAIMDYMCESHILAKTGMSIAQHQQKTTENCVDLLNRLPEAPWWPVLQGFKKSDYLDHVELYAKSGIDLTKFDTVGVGSICRREGTNEAADIINTIADLGINVHCFGFKVQGIPRVYKKAVSADSMAWSFGARQIKTLLPEHRGKHGNCANCFEMAILWRAYLLSKLEEKYLHVNCHLSIERWVGFQHRFGLIKEDMRPSVRT